ncbi:MAG: hypothetical protein WBA23_06965, partial [Tunicatimonas sp.]|uniref:hypothetical protein n=1 Tax=Tunicatimonas sp. TaxID=1940096 RepID=UPI003C735EAD
MSREGITGRFIKVHHYLVENGLVKNQRDFATELDAHTQSISAIFNGKRSVTLDHLAHLFRVDGVSPYSVFLNKGPIIIRDIAAQLNKDQLPDGEAFS